MKSKLHSSLIVLALLALSTLNSEISSVLAQGTAFSYQGQLNSGNPAVPAKGEFSVLFSLFLDQAGTTPAPGVPPYAVTITVNNGVLNALVDFGPNVFTGTAYWMQIQVKEVAPNPDSAFTTLTPLVPVTPTPSAIYATTAGNFTGNVSVSQLPPTVVVTGESGVTFNSVTVNGTISGNGSGILSLNGAQVVSVGNGNPLPSGPGSPPTFSAGNFFVGPSGNGTATGSQNTALGDLALQENTSGGQDTAIGFNALNANTEGSENTALGNDALYTNNGSGNTAIGNAALYSNTGGSENTALGNSALLGNTTGSDNTAIGDTALIQNANGSDNTAHGSGALYDNTSGSENTAIGVNALFANMTGSGNIALGYWAGFYPHAGSSNIYIGSQGASADNNIIRIGSGQTSAYIAGVINGNGAGLSNLTLNAAQLTSIGNADGGSGNFFVGPSGNSSTSGSDNTAIGNTALPGNTSGSDNTALGFAALVENATGSENTAIGGYALQHGGVNNIGLGWGAGAGLSGDESNNIEIGNLGVAGDNNVIRLGTSGLQTSAFIAGVITGDGGGLTNLNASQLTSVGNGNGSLPTSVYNFFVGPSGNSSTTGNENTAIGVYSLSNNTSGFKNTANGAYALYSNTAGYYNTAIGAGALASVTNGAGNIALGYLAGNGFVGNESDNIDIGNLGTPGDINIIRIGTQGAQTATYLTGTVYANNVALASDRNVKENFTAVNPRAVLEKVAALPITEWKYKAEPEGAEHLGPMAQDFHAAFGLNGTDDKHIAMVDEQGVALAAIQGLNQKLESQNASLRAENTALEQRLNRLEKIVSSQQSKERD